MMDLDGTATSGPSNSEGDGGDGRERSRQEPIKEAAEGDRAGGRAGEVGAKEGGGFVYFIETEDGNFVKSGKYGRVWKKWLSIRKSWQYAGGAGMSRHPC